jgi:hypothetical protein
MKRLMSIKVKTRKILWSKSGNRCALCKCQLVEKLQNHSSDFIVGEECHIISSKSAGPRGSIIKLDDHDIYENLILLCSNHHKLIDEFPETYTHEVLMILKNNHEHWITKAIDKDLEELNRTINNVEYLDKISSWSQIDNIIQNAHLHFNDFTSISDKSSAIELGDFFNNLNDLSDIYSDIDLSKRTKYLIDCEHEIKQFENQGILIFGKGLLKEYKLANIPKSEYKVSMFVAVHENANSGSIQNNKLVIRLPDDFTPTF